MNDDWCSEWDVGRRIPRGAAYDVIESTSSEKRSSAYSPRSSMSGLNRTVPCHERVRHALLSARLQKAYVIYCVFCFFLSSLICGSSLARAAGTSAWNDVSSHRWESWETMLEIGIGLVVCVETLCTLWLTGPREFFRDAWCVFDIGVVALTMMSWVLLFTRSAVISSETFLQLDMPLLILRFILQPCRMLATASMARRVRKMQQNTMDIAFDVLTSIPDMSPVQCGHILSVQLQQEICEHLPVWCRFRDWQLAYSRSEHGTSMQTFYRMQTRCAANLLIVRDGVGTIFGGFSTEPWRIDIRGYHSSGDAFVFSKHLGRPASFFHTVAGYEVLVWGDSRQVALSEALVLGNDFISGTSTSCKTFASPMLSAEGPEFSVSAFECWHFDDFQAEESELLPCHGFL